MRNDGGRHRLRGNKAERTPKHLMSWDTETVWTTGNDAEVHRLRCWAASVTHRNGGKAKPGGADAGEGTTVKSLCDYIESVAPHGETLWLAAHNQQFDLAVTALPVRLAERGWEVTGQALASTSPWLRMRRGTCRLALIDSHSYLPQALARIGIALGIEKPPRPDNDDSPAAWMARCRADVDILQAAMLQLMDWWDEGRFGCWSITGPATGWNAYRHIPTMYPVTIGRDDAARAYERSMISGGRRECWRVGPQPKARYIELDFAEAHLTIARFLPLPQRRSVKLGRVELDDTVIDNDRWGVVGDCVVRTETPRYPMSHAGRTWFPVGKFKTRLCGPEIAEARKRGDLVEITDATMHKLGPHMADWGEWLAGVLANFDGKSPAAAVIAAKGWSRTVPGRWATRTSEVIKTLRADTEGWQLERGCAHPGGQPFARMSLGGTEWWTVQDLEGDDSYPAVLAWVQSAVRLRLGRLIDALSRYTLIACNTDGVIIRAPQTPDLYPLAELCWPLTPRVKAVYDNIDVISPQHLLLDGHKRLSGVSSQATKRGDGKYEWFTWPSLRSQLERGHSEGYRRDKRASSLDSVPIARWVTSNGTCIPVTAEIDENGNNRIRHPDLIANALPGTRLREAQHPALTEVLRDSANSVRNSLELDLVDPAGDAPD